MIQNRISLNEETFQFLLQFSPLEKQQRILRQRIVQNALNMVVGGALARYMLWKEWEIKPDARIACEKFGKPYLPDHPNAHFNISHSGQFVVCAVCNTPIGIDVQEIIPYRPDIAKKVCNNTELVQIEAAENRSVEFTKIWTRKEAAVKKSGLGIGCDLSFEILSSQEIHSIHIENIFISIAI